MDIHFGLVFGLVSSKYGIHYTTHTLSVIDIHQTFASDALCVRSVPWTPAMKVYKVGIDGLVNFIHILWARPPSRPVGAASRALADTATYRFHCALLGVPCLWCTR